ncbi:hypothetical protein FE257_012759 [Aspergillus nanangensis]|uniref:Uncharacterized protein n=1 Tax=Aspergillus nanangensis TaxID=2582783 RepID=A0AAD4GRN2_ASPNN|nr:hypothetical protein FE257_012759 [Aspergillus nanangensis]
MTTYIDIPLTEEEEAEIENIVNGPTFEQEIDYPWEKATSFNKQPESCTFVLTEPLRGHHKLPPGKITSYSHILHTNQRPTTNSHDGKNYLSTMCWLKEYRHRLKEALTMAQASRSSFRYDWPKIISERSAEQWANDISDITVDQFKCLLGRPFPPTFEELEQLGYHDTENMGVYMSPIRELDRDGDKFLYAGSATSDRGLKHRITQH